MPKDLIYEDMFKKAPEWITPHWYHVGDLVRWKQHLLRCGVDHYSGADAVDPWDPGHGWKKKKQMKLWEVVVPTSEYK